MSGGDSTSAHFDFIFEELPSNRASAYILVIVVNERADAETRQ